MGTTVTNVHVHVGDGPLAAEQVAAAMSQPALVSPAEGGWVSIFPADELPGDDSLAKALSVALDRPVVNFFCFDSDIAVADLIVAGEALDQIVVAWPGVAEEMMDDDELALGELVPGITARTEVRGDLERWRSTLGTAPSITEIVAAINADPQCPFAEQTAGEILGRLGIPERKLVMGHRYYEHGEDPETSATFLRV
jgi:hypothetical protein